MNHIDEMNNDFKENQVKYFKNVFSKKGINHSIDEVFQQIKSPRLEIIQLRKLKQPSSEYDKAKLDLPVVKWNQVKGLMYFDYDLKTLSDDQLKDFRKKLEGIPFIYSNCLSSGGKGFASLVRYSTDEYTEEFAWNDLYQFIAKKIDAITGGIHDSKCNDRTRNNFISSDLEFYLNEESQVFTHNIVKKEEGSFVGNIKEERADITRNDPYVKLTEKPKRYYSRSFVDVHYSHLLEQAIHVDERLGYAIFDIKQDVMKLFCPKSLIKQYTRNRYLHFILIINYALNPTYSKEKLWQWFQSWNSSWVEDPLKESELIRIFNNIIEKFDNGTIEINANKQAFTHFFSTCKLDADEKRTIANKAKTIISKHKIKMAIAQLQREGKTPTKTAVMAITGHKSKVTVQKYWNEFLHPVQDELQTVEKNNKIEISNDIEIDIFDIIGLSEDEREFYNKKELEILKI